MRASPCECVFVACRPAHVALLWCVVWGVWCGRCGAWGVGCAVCGVRRHCSAVQVCGAGRKGSVGARPGGGRDVG